MENRWLQYGQTWQEAQARVYEPGLRRRCEGGIVPPSDLGISKNKGVGMSFVRGLSALNQPVHMMAIAALTRVFGSFRVRERMGLVQPRPSYAYGLLRAADLCVWMGKKKATVIEFGVAGGMGLIAMADVADEVKSATGVEFRVVGFDTGSGLPRFEGAKDHPELWVPGDFAMPDPDKLRERMRGRAELVFGDIEDTVGLFLKTLTPDAPLGFISVDVDLYSASVSCLRVLTGAPELYTPAVSVYIDDVTTFFNHRWGGELAAVHEFSDSQPSRKIDKDYSLPGHRPFKNLRWYDRMFVAHILDHELRTRTRTREEVQGMGPFENFYDY